MTTPFNPHKGSIVFKPWSLLKVTGKVPGQSSPEHAAIDNCNKAKRTVLQMITGVKLKISYSISYDNVLSLSFFQIEKRDSGVGPL